MRLEETIEYRSYLCLANVCGTLRSDDQGSDGDYDDSGYYEAHLTELFGTDIDEVFESQHVDGVFGTRRWGFTDPANGFSGDDLHARLFHDRDHDVYYLVNRPTETFDDKITGIMTAIGAGVPDQFHQAAQLIALVRPEFRDRVVLSGLSLGGALSAYAATQAPWHVRTVVFDPLGLNRKMMGQRGLGALGQGEVLSDRFRSLDDVVAWYYIAHSWVAKLNIERHLSSVGRVTELPQDPVRATNNPDTHDFRHVRFGVHKLWDASPWGDGALRRQLPQWPTQYSARQFPLLQQNRPVAFPPRGGDGFVSVAELVKALPTLGLPHFQRGRVWDDRAVSMLMESLIDDTPCGSIILWRPAGRITRQGEVPGDWGESEGKPRLLVVDGQQRLTALRALWFDSSDNRWAVNLVAFPEFGLNRHRVESPEPFVRWPQEPPTEAGPTTRDNYALRTRHLVPLSWVRSSDSLPPIEEGVEASTWGSLVARIRHADERRFHVLVKRGCELPEIVNLYNRINSSGVPVRKEERAYAAMVSIDPRTPDWLRDCFQAAHPDKQNSGREAWLKRERERFFGFPLFISCYAQTVGFHRNLKGDLDLLARDNPDTSWVEVEGNRDAMRTDSLRCIRHTAQTLRSHLLCDDLRFLPSAEPLRLGFAMLLKYPGIDDDSLAAVLLLGQLNRITGHTRPKRIEQSILESNRLIEAMSAFPSAQEMLGDQRTFEKRLLKVESMNDPWVSLMYWYQRAHGSSDYVGRCLPLNLSAAATKEHVVPFSLLYRHYGVDPRGHSASHVVNAIGNLTMVSSAMNYGHGADPIPLRGIDPHLLRAHHLDDPEVLQRYTAVIRAIETGAASERIRSRYERFVRVRTHRLADGMYSWISSTTQQRPANPDMSPHARRMNPSPADLFRAQKGIPRSFKDAVLSIGVKGDGSLWLLHRTSGKSTRADKIRLDHNCDALHVGLRVPGVTALTAQLGSRLKERYRDDREVVYGLNPRGSSAREALGMVAAFLGP